jgi:hypothetical protein
MTEQQYRVIADRDRGDWLRPQDIQDGDRYTLNAPYFGDSQIVRIERPVPDSTNGQQQYPTREQIAAKAADEVEYRVRTVEARRGVPAGLGEQGDRLRSRRRARPVREGEDVIDVTRLPARFAAKVDFSAAGGCWLWTASVLHNGYARYWDGDREHRAHRFAYEQLVEPIPDSLFLDHICAVRSCVNPSHLRLATNKQNLEHRLGATAVSKSGVRGVFWNKQKRRWTVQAKHNGKSYHGGYFTALEDAERAAVKLRSELFTHDRVTPPPATHQDG